MQRLVMAERASKRIRKKARNKYNNTYKRLKFSDDLNELWFEWGVDQSGFHTAADFLKFCDIAGVDMTKFKPQPVDRFGHSANTYVSKDKKVSFRCGGDPTNPGLDGNIGYFGLTGVRDRSRLLLQFFMEHGRGDFEVNDRSYC